MQFLKTLLIVLVVAVAVAFGFNNWAPVELRLWGGLIAEIKLPILMVVCLVAGWLPTWLWQRAVRWRLQQRLTSSERTVAELRAVQPPSTPASAMTGESFAINSAPPLIDEPRT